MKETNAYVLSKKMHKTAILGVDWRKVHPLYGKRMKRTTRLYAQDDLGVKKGDIVLIQQTRPISKLKRWRIIKILKGGKGLI